MNPFRPYIETLTDLQLTPTEIEVWEAENEVVTKSLKDHYQCKKGYIKDQLLLENRKNDKDINDDLFSLSALLGNRIVEASREEFIEIKKITKTDIVRKLESCGREAIKTTDLHLEVELADIPFCLFLNLQSAIASIAAIKLRYDMQNQDIILPNPWDALKSETVVLFWKEERSGQYIRTLFNDIVNKDCTDEISACNADSYQEEFINYQVVYISFRNTNDTRFYIPMPARIICKLHELSKNDNWQEIFGPELIERLKNVSAEQLRVADIKNVDFYAWITLNENEISIQDTAITDDEIKGVLSLAMQISYLSKYMALHTLDVTGKEQALLAMDYIVSVICRGNLSPFEQILIRFIVERGFNPCVASSIVSKYRDITSINLVSDLNTYKRFIAK